MMHHNHLLQLQSQRTAQSGDSQALDQSGTSSDGAVTNEGCRWKIMGFRAPPADTVFMLVNEMMSCKIILAAPTWRLRDTLSQRSENFN